MTKVDALVVDRPGYGAVESSCHADMVWIPGGTFHMGSDRHYAEESPVHRVVVDGFWIDRTPVTNRQFRRFVASTGHITFAEIAPDPKDYPKALPHTQGGVARLQPAEARLRGIRSQWTPQPAMWDSATWFVRRRRNEQFKSRGDSTR